MTRILPALLTHTVTNYTAHLRAAEPYFTEAQVDLMDGIFVPNKSISARELRRIPTTLKLEAHLMVEDPINWIEQSAAAGVKRMIVHQEIGTGLISAIRLVKSLGLSAGLAINPESDPLAAKEWWNELDLIQVMGVIPGHYDAEFQPGTLEMLRAVREGGFSGLLQVDGGVTPQTAPMLVSSGAGSLVVGHYFFGSEKEPDLANIGEKLKVLRTALGSP